MALNRLKKALGPFGFLADALSVIQTNWGALVSLLLGLGSVSFAGAYHFVTDPYVRTFGTVFLAAIWTYIALSLLYRLHKGIRTIPLIDYAHGILVEGVMLAYDPDENDPAIQISVNIRNVTNGPISISVEEYRIVIENRTIPDTQALAMVVPRVGVKGITSGQFKKDAVKDRAEGTLSLVLHYGAPEEVPVRRFKIRTKLYIRLKDQIGVGNMIELEEDTPL